MGQAGDPARAHDRAGSGARVEALLWNAVCDGAAGLAAMLVERDPQRLTAVLRRVLQGLPAHLSGFTADGGCSEEPG